jgi:DNA-binding CsgD family transcriptional regulator
MADNWGVAKHVMFWKALPPGVHPDGSDPIVTLLGRIADAARADEFHEIERLCRRALRDVPGHVIPLVFLAARLIVEGRRFDEAAELIAAHGTTGNPEQRAWITALSASAAAHTAAHRDASERYAAESVRALEDVDDDLFSGYVEARLAEAATWRGDIVAARELAGRATRRFARYGADALAATTITMLILPELDAGDLDTVHALLTAGEEHARRSGSRALQRTYTTFRLTIGAMTGDDAMVEVASAGIDGLSKHDTFVARVYATMPYAWHGRWHDYLATIRQAEPVTQAHWALQDAMRAICAAALRDDAEARSRWRRAVHRLASGPRWNLSDTRVRRIARALACAAGVTVGDVARAQRAALPLRGTRQLAVFTGEPEPTCAGFQRIVAAMQRRRVSSQPAVTLTPAQIAILKLLATDASIAQIARDDPQRRSPATIRSHVQSLYELLDVHSRTGAVMKAKELSLL